MGTYVCDGQEVTATCSDPVNTSCSNICKSLIGFLKCIIKN